MVTTACVVEIKLIIIPIVAGGNEKKVDTLLNLDVDLSFDLSIPFKLQFICITALTSYV